MQKITLFSIGFFLSFSTLAQNWVNGGNTLTAIGQFGTKSNSSIIFKTFNTERGRLTKEGLWGFGTIRPNAKVSIASAPGLAPLRVSMNGSNGSTKLFINPQGATSIGVAADGPVDGLHVKGQVSIGVVTPAEENKVEIRNEAHFSHGLYAFARNIGVVGEAEGIGLRGIGSIGVQGFSKNENLSAVHGVNDSTGAGGSFLSRYGSGIYASTLEGTYAGYFAGDIFTGGVFSGSDQRIKQNIREAGNALTLINQLQPKQYEFKRTGEFAALHLPKGQHYGLLAQDVEKVLPDLVKETNQIKAVNYTELITVLIKAVQEQEERINALTEEVSRLKNKSPETTAYGGLNGVSLEQNHPNPVTDKTTFKYTIPTGSRGEIMVYEALTGRLVKRLAAPASGSLEMNSIGLADGPYVYTLAVDGKVAGSSQLVISKE